MYRDKFSRQAWLVSISPFAAYSGVAAAADTMITLSGNQEVPPVKGAGTGSGTILVGADKMVLPGL